MEHKSDKPKAVTKRLKKDYERQIVGSRMDREPAPVETFFDKIGQDKMLAALRFSDDPKHHRFLQGLLYDGNIFKPISFVSQCAKYEVGIMELVDLVNNYQFMEGKAKMMQHFPQIMEDTAIDAKSRVEACPRCDGLGEVDGAGKGETRPCPLCKGAKEVRVAGDKVARELVMEASGMTGKKGPTVAIQQNFGQPNSIENIAKFTQKVLVPNE